MSTNKRIPLRTFAADRFIDEMVDAEKRIDLILNQMEQGFRVDVNTLTDLKRSYEPILFSIEEAIQKKLGRHSG